MTYRIWFHLCEVDMLFFAPQWGKRKEFIITGRGLTTTGQGAMVAT